VLRKGGEAHAGPASADFKLSLRLRLIDLLHRLGLAPPVHYIGSNEVLPPPLTLEEEQELLGGYRRGIGK